MTKRSKLLSKIEKRLRAEFGDSLENVEIFEKRKFIRVKLNKQALVPLCKILANEFNFEQLTSVAGVDYKKYFENVYHVSSFAREIMAELHTELDHDDPHVDSVTHIWSAAKWHECEAYDMMGIIFDNHPRLQRVLMPEETPYFPQRKDMPLGGPADDPLKHRWDRSKLRFEEATVGKEAANG